MPAISWRHERERLVLPIVVFTGLDSLNPNQNMRVEGLLDTGATGTGIRGDVATHLQLRQKGQRRVYTANGMLMAPEYVVRIGFICGDYTDPDFQPDTMLPYVLDRPLTGFGLGRDFAYPILIGMDVIGYSDLSLTRDGMVRLTLP